MPKSSKKFVIISNKVNNYGYRVDTTGMDLTQYEKNPILLFMHSRAFSSSTEQILPLGHMQDLKLESNGDITGVPFFSDADEFAMQVFNKVEDGTYRMLSAGFEAIETNDDPDQLLQGQRYATVSKSKLREISVVDIGGDDNALCLFHDGKLLQLDDANDTSKIIPSINQNLKNTEMKETLIPMLLLVGLTKDSTSDQLMTKLNELKQKADKADELAGTIVTLNDTIGTLQKAAIDAEIDAEVDAAYNARKITEAQKPFYKQMGESNLNNLKQLFAAMPGAPTLQSHLDNGASADDPILKLNYAEAHTSGKLAEIKTKYPDRYKQIFKEKFGKEPSA